MNDETGVCRGCFRTLDEIARWSQMSDEERAAVVAALPAMHPAGASSATSDRKT